MTVDEAKAIAAKPGDLAEAEEALCVLADAVRDDDLVVAPEGVSVTDNSRHRIIHGMIYCFRKDLPKPTRTVVLNEWACHCELSGWYMLWSEKKPGDGLWNTGNTREIEVQHE